MHPEDIKAEIRKRNGSVAAFIRAKNLPVSGVSDLLNGKISRPVAHAIAEELNLPVTFVFPSLSPERRRRASKNSDTKPIRAARHRQNSPSKLTGEPA
jgi:lambda repressor-like predicted transcriptional regulator